MMRGKDIGYNMRRLSVNSLLPTDVIVFDLKKEELFPKILLNRKLNIYVRKTDLDRSDVTIPAEIKIYDIENENQEYPDFNVFIKRHSGFKNGLDIQLDVA